MTTRQTLLEDVIMAVRARGTPSDPNFHDEIDKALAALDAFEGDDVGDVEKLARDILSKDRGFELDDMACSDRQFRRELNLIKAGYSARDGEVSDLVRQKEYLESQNESLRMIKKEPETTLTAKDELSGREDQAAQIANQKIRDAARCELGGDHEIDVEPSGYYGWKVNQECRYCNKRLVLVAAE